MQILKRLLLSVLAMGFLLLLIERIVFPSEYSVTHSAEINAEAQDILQILDDSVYSRSFLHQESEVELISNETFHEKMHDDGREIYHRIGKKFQCELPFRENIVSTLLFKPNKDGVSLEWKMDNHVSMPFKRYFSFFLKGWMLRDMKKGIHQLTLKLIQEGKTLGYVHNVLVSENKVPNWGLSHNYEVHQDSLSIVLDDLMQFAREHVLEQGLKPLYSPYFMIVGRTDSLHYKLKVGSVVESAKGYKGNAYLDKFQGTIVYTHYFGKWKNISKAVRKIEEYAGQNGYLLRGTPVYSKDVNPFKDGPYAGLYPMVVGIYALD